MGRITRREGRPGWYAVWRDGRGRRRRRRVPGSKREAQRRLAELELAAWRAREGVGDGLVEDAEVASLRAAWQAEIQTRCRPRTWQSYEQALDELLAWLRADAEARGLGAVRTTADIRLEAVRRFAAGQLAAGRAARTVQKKVATLRQMLRWGVAEGLIPSNPLARWRPLKGPLRRRRRALTEFEIAKLLQASPPALRDIWVVFLGTGLRAGELVALEWDDVDLEGGELTVRAEVSKSKRSRLVPLSPGVWGVLRRHRLRCPSRQRRVFVQANGNPWGGAWGNQLSRRIHGCLEAAGLDARIDLHCLRHSFGSHLVRHGADVKTVQSLLGHSSATVTLDIYAHEFASAKREAVELMPLPMLAAPYRRPSRKASEG